MAAYTATQLQSDTWTVLSDASAVQGASFHFSAVVLNFRQITSMQSATRGFPGETTGEKVATTGQVWPHF